jgi:hypothetical protein
MSVGAWYVRPSLSGGPYLLICSALKAPTKKEVVQIIEEMGYTVNPEMIEFHSTNPNK